MFGASEIYLILRARNEAAIALASTSKQLNSIAIAQARVNEMRAAGIKVAGSQAAADLKSAKAAKAATVAQIARGKNLITIGAGMAIVGGIGVNAFNKMTNEAIKYNQQVSLTLTQVDKAKVSFKDLSDIGLRVARTVPVAFDDIQKSLYDIFSSLDTNGPGAEKILKAIAQASVGGATDMATAGRAIIAVLNAYKLPAQQVTHVSDVLFQLVRKGVGTYSQFAAVIGRAVPSALKAGQSIEDLAGMMAFLTRNGLSAAMASASASRALDALSKPTAIKNLHDMGIEVQDASGKFRPMVDIVSEMRDKLGKLTPVARAIKLNEIFKGAGGTIQAMRFFNLGISDSNGLLKEMTNDMHNSSGAASSAYKVMSNTPQAKVQQLKNQYQAMRIELGNNLIPVKLALVKALSAVLNWFNKLNPTVKKWITYILAATAVAMILVGVIIAMAGAFLILTAAAAAFEIGAAPLLGIIALIILAIIAIAAAVFFVIKYWKQISSFAVRIWNDVYKAVAHAASNVVHAWDNAYHAVKSTWDAIYKAISTAVNEVVMAIAHAWQNVVHSFDNVLHALDNLDHAWSNLWHAIINVWNAVMPVIRGIGLFFYAVLGIQIKLIFEALKKTWQITWDVVSAIWNTVGHPIFTAILDTVRFMWSGVKIIWRAQVSLWRATWNLMKATWNNVGRPIFDFILSSIKFMWTSIRVIWNAMITVWRGTWNLIRGIWDNIGKPVFTAAGNSIKAIWRNVISPTFTAISNGWRSLWSGMSNVFSSIWNGVQRAIRGALNGIISVINAFIGGINALLGHLPGHFHIDKIGTIADPNAKGPAHTPNTRGFARGGVLPGYSPGKDNIRLPAYMFSGGEGILIPEAVRAIGGKRGIDRINSMFSNRRSMDKSGMFIGGGIIGGIAGALKSTVGAVEGGLRKGVAAMLRAGLNLAEAPVKAALGSMPGGIIKDISSGGYQKVDQVIRSMIDDLGGKARKAAAKAAASSVGSQGNVTGAGALANQAYAKGQLGRFGWGLDQMGSLINLWNGECVPLRTRILTKRGWLSHGEVEIGDETLGYNPILDCNEWTRITRIVHYEDREVQRLGNRNWQVDVTPGHRWWSEPLESVIKKGGAQKVPGFVRTDELRWGHRIRLSAIANTDGIPTLSLQDAAVLAWIQGDGTLTETSNGKWDGRIYQSKLSQIVRIRAMLVGIDYTETISNRSNSKANWLPEHIFLLPRHSVTDLVKRSQIMDYGLEQFILGLSIEQRSAWLAAMIDAEGHSIGQNGDRGHTTITQNNGEMQDAIKLAVYLEGFKPSRTAHGESAGRIGMTVPYISKFQITKLLERQDVWCVTTELGSWTAEQDGRIFLTGNSGWSQFAKNPSSGAYGIPQALPASKMASSGSDWLTNPATQINWGLNYIRGRYGSPSNAYGTWLNRSPHWYGGGMSPTVFDTPTVIGVGERGAETVSVTPGRGTGPSQNFYITTQEIDPVKHAADLGWEFSRRVG